MQKNWLRLTHVAYNMDYVKKIILLPEVIEIYTETEQNSFSRKSADGRAVAHWLETQVSPMTDGTEPIAFA